MDSNCLAQSNLIHHLPFFQCSVNLISYDMILKKRYEPRSVCHPKMTMFRQYRTSIIHESIRWNRSLMTPVMFPPVMLSPLRNSIVSSRPGNKHMKITCVDCGCSHDECKLSNSAVNNRKSGNM